MNLSFLAAVSVLIHVSVNFPTPDDPKAYDLGQCSGVFITPTHVLTSAHCFENSRDKQWVKTSDGKSFSAKLLKRDKRSDLALLEVDTPLKHQFVKLGKVVDRADKVYSFGASHGLMGTYNEGIVNNVVMSNKLQIFHSAHFAVGASGSGLFTKDHKLVGINRGTMQNFSISVDLLEIKHFLAS